MIKTNVDYSNEIWKDIEGFEGLYRVSNLGRVVSLSRYITSTNDKRNGTRKEKLLSTTISESAAIENKKYMRVTLNEKGNKHQISVHRLVAIAFLPNPNNLPAINHINGLKWDNRSTNLEWCTYAENSQHATRTGLQTNPSFQGSKHHKAKLSESMIVEIKKLCQTEKASAVAQKYGVRTETILSIKRGSAWKHV